MRTKKKILYLLMAFCLMAGQMPMQVQAEEEPQVEEVTQEEECAVTELSDLTVSGQIPVALTATNDSTDIYVAGVGIAVDTYYKTTEDGSITVADASDYNVHCTQEGDQYVLTLKDATINGQIYSGNALKIVLEGSNTVTGTNSMNSPAIMVNSASLVVEGSGALKATSAP